ncbi:hypothetical protein CGRA01v4_03413 [Colletotrichum graminicola]|nr:hypothetical protein CGRA01v4_03413 [Colletotrichum graminicola]
MGLGSSPCPKSVIPIFLPMLPTIRRRSGVISRPGLSCYRSATFNFYNHHHHHQEVELGEASVAQIGQSKNLSFYGCDARVFVPEEFDMLIETLLVPPLPNHIDP